jgi:hypothetical protein
MDSYLDRVNPNLLITLHYVGKLAWLGLAAVFGLVGYNLYALGIAQTGSADVGVPGILSLTLKDAGPGLIVMVFALVCTVIGTIRSKVVLKPGEISFSAPLNPDRISPPPAIHSIRECKLFTHLAAYLAKGPSAFVVLNSLHQVDIESFGWSVVPENVREVTLREIARRAALTDDEGSALTLSISAEGWRIRCDPISLDGKVVSWVVSVEPSNAARQREIASADTRPLMST